MKAVSYHVSIQVIGIDLNGSLEGADSRLLLLVLGLDITEHHPSAAVRIILLHSGFKCQSGFRKTTTLLCQTNTLGHGIRVGQVVVIGLELVRSQLRSGNSIEI